MLATRNCTGIKETFLIFFVSFVILLVTLFEQKHFKGYFYGKKIVPFERDILISFL